MHPATKTFQALRIEVNRELDELKNGLDASLRILRTRGKALCYFVPFTGGQGGKTFHKGQCEDRGIEAAHEESH